ncbi:DMT family transporter [Psychroserpens sp. MEBiC05023]
MKWIYLFGSIAFEVLGTTAMKMASQGGKNTTLWTVTLWVSYIICFGLLQYAMKYFELGTVYAIWSGIGITILAIIGYFVFKDNFTTAKVISIALIILGIIGLNLSGAH